MRGDGVRCKRMLSKKKQIAVRRMHGEVGGWAEVAAVVQVVLTWPGTKSTGEMTGPDTNSCPCQTQYSKA